jgi:signal transduction histidine kinase/putative methionine-R-sulfoxide reductase with GAF domain
MPGAIEQQVAGIAPPSDGEIRSVARLKMLQSLAAKLNRLNDVSQIGEAIIGELRTLIDYHNCRVYLIAPDGSTMMPIAFRGSLGEYLIETYDALILRVGEGVTGRVAATGRSIYAPDANVNPYSKTIPGTNDVDESLMAVPMAYGDRVIGAIVLSKLGIDQFDDEDLRMLETLASHAAVAIENARLLELERESATTARELLKLSQALTKVHDADAVLEEAIASIPVLLGSDRVMVYTRNPDTGGFRPTKRRGFDLDAPALDSLPEVPPDVAAPFVRMLERPIIVDKEMLLAVPAEYLSFPDLTERLLAPIRWEPDGLGVILILAQDQDASFSQRDLELASGLADITSLAIGNATRFHELERFHGLVEGLNAIFWEANADTLQFSFVSHRAEDILSHGVERWQTERRHWGDHIDRRDRERAVAECRAAIAAGGDHQFEYRATAPGRKTIWLRDIAHVIEDAAGLPRQLRGVIVDITERKRAEEELRKSKRKYSEAFRREKEAAQRLRNLDEMKNTFLQAVSHDLRTPLTAVLGTAVTLGRQDIELSPEDSRDLLVRLISNARKLDRLLSDLLDLDRLARGIVEPKRHPTDVGALVRRVVAESDLMSNHPVAVDAAQVVVGLDAPKVERIVENLLANSARHTPAGTHVWIRVAARDDGALLVVEDDGPGIAEEFRDAIFEPFRQGPDAPRHSPGVGVGLSLVARFAELHGGRAWAEDRVGGGSSFHVFLPPAAEESADPN